MQKSASALEGGDLLEANLFRKINQGECHVWWASRSDAHSSLLSLISATEKERYQSFRLQQDRDRALVSYALLRILVAKYLHKEPEVVPINRTCPQCGKPHGKPTLVAPFTGQLEVSVSHSGDRIVIAIGKDPLGIDIEQIRMDQAVEEMASAVLSPTEIKEVDTAKDPKRAFYTYWTRKEAITKALGQGIVLPLTEMEVSSYWEEPRFLSYKKEPNLPASFCMGELDFGVEYHASLAVIGPLQKVSIRNAASLLHSFR